MDTLWMTYGYRGHMGSGISLSIGEVKVMLGVTTNDTLGGGWTEQTPYQLKNSKNRAPPFRDNKESQRM